jgi:sister-chromatid-cohesion protein PDS5
MTTLLRRASYSIVNQSSIPLLFKRVVHGEDSTNARALQRAEAAQSLLRITAKHSPALFKAHVGELCKLIADENKGVSVELAVMALANVVKWDEKIGGIVDKSVSYFVFRPFLTLSFFAIILDAEHGLLLIYRKTNERIFRLALDSDWRQAKFAARYLAFCKNKNDLCTELVEVCHDPQTFEEQLPNQSFFFIKR